VLGPAAGVATAATWGFGDFSGGLAAKRQPVFVVVLLSQAIGLALVGAVALLVREPLPGLRGLLWAAAAGLAGGVGVTALYASLASGRMGIAAPITGVVAAVIPVSYTWLRSGLPSALGLAGVALAFVGIILVSGPKAERPSPRVLALALTSGCGFAGFLLLLGLAGRDSYFWTLTAARVGSSFACLGIVLVTRPGWGRPGWSVLGAALGDTLGNAFFLIATRLTSLDVAVMLSSLYPVTTVLLARLVLKEHLTWMQGIGSALMLAAIPMVALG
jgi:drug/metabolite transporter (DMT)-like permease